MKISLALALCLVSVLLLPHCDAQVSRKSRKLSEGGFGGGGDNWGSEEEEEDVDIFAGEDDFDMGFSLDDFDDEGFGDEEEGDGDSLFGGDGVDLNLPLCTNTTVDFTTCRNETVEEEPRLNDVLLERLLEQVWEDMQNKLQQEGSKVGNVILDPMDIDSQLPEPIDLRQSGAGFDVRVKMSGMRLFGLSRIRLDRAAVTRGENLTDMAVDVRFAFDSLLINGTYSMKGTVGWWDLDSNGTRAFSIAMTNATFSYKMLMEMVDGFESSFSCGPEGSVQITEIRLPLEYDDVNFDFKNLGAFANSVVNGVGIYFLQSQEDAMVKKLRSEIKEKFNSLIC